MKMLKSGITKICGSTYLKRTRKYGKKRFIDKNQKLSFRIKNPEYISSPRSYVLTKIYVMMLNDYFAPTLYQALLAEVNWNLEMEYVSRFNFWLGTGKF